MPSVKVICIKYWIDEVESKDIEYNSGETLSSVLHKFDDKFDKLNSDDRLSFF